MGKSLKFELLAVFLISDVSHLTNGAWQMKEHGVYIMSCADSL